MHVSLDSNSGELLPKSTEPDKDQCSKPDQNLYCFKGMIVLILFNNKKFQN